MSFCEAAALGSCYAVHSGWDVEGRKHGRWAGSPATGSIVADVLVERLLRKENATTDL